MLDGSVAAATPNVLVYATSNRRHLLPEYMTDNLATPTPRTARSTRRGGGGEDLAVRALRPVGQLLPLQPGRIPAIVAQWLQPWACRPPRRRPEALVWALERGSRSGRVAYQFARDFAGRAHG
jgi:predicted AAA+ superfamily ATPase